MKQNLAGLAAAALIGMTALVASIPAAADELAIQIAPSASNRVDPQMGDHLAFQTRLTNTGTTPIDGVISWLSIVRVDQGQEAPIGLEDWSAEKAVTQTSPAPNPSRNTIKCQVLADLLRLKKKSVKSRSGTPMATGRTRADCTTGFARTAKSANGLAARTVPPREAALTTAR